MAGLFDCLEDARCKHKTWTAGCSNTALQRRLAVSEEESGGVEEGCERLRVTRIGVRRPPIRTQAVLRRSGGTGGAVLWAMTPRLMRMEADGGRGGLFVT